eukprot:scaffold22210_cov58-Phaeocystis_antarctica.AAC.4
MVGSSSGGGVSDGSDGSCFITDLSAWGTYVDGDKLPFKKQTPLRLGAMITVATDQLQAAILTMALLTLWLHRGAPHSG